MAEARYTALPDLGALGVSRGDVCMIDRIYRDLLARPPDAGGLGGYLAALAAGKPIARIVEEFIIGAEFIGRSVAPPADMPGFLADLRDLARQACPRPPTAPLLSPSDRVAYHWWIEAFEAPWRAHLRARMRADGATPTIGVLIGEPRARINPATIASIRSGWAGGAQPGPILFADDTPADLAAVEWLVVLPRSCQLAETWRAEICAAGADDAARVMIADEDRMDADGTRHDPWFKSDADWQLTGRPRGRDGLVALRRCLVAEITLAALHKALDGNEDLLALVAGLPEAARRHIPRVLSHATTPAAPRPPPRQPATVQGRLPRASVVIPTRDRRDLLVPLVEDLRFRTRHEALEIVIVDNDSGERLSRDVLHRLATSDLRCRVLAMPGPFNWAAANQAGAEAAQGEVLVFLNNDMCVLAPDWLGALVAEACRPSTGIVGAALFYPDGTVQHAGMVLRDDGTAHHVLRHAPADSPDYENWLRGRRRVSAVTGACMAMRRDVLTAAGGLDATRYRITCSDTDLCLRVAGLGLEIVWTPEARLMHLELATRRADHNAEPARRAAAEQAARAARWPAALRRDRFWSPNLAYGEGPPALACPPRWPA